MNKEVAVAVVLEILGGRCEGFPVDVLARPCALSDMVQDGFGFAKDTYRSSIDHTVRCTIVVREAPDFIPTNSRIQWLLVDHPEIYFWDAVERFFLNSCGDKDRVSSIHPSVVMGKDVMCAEGTSVGPHVVLGDHVTLGRRVVLHAGVQIGADVTIGDDCVLFSGVTLYPGVNLGHRVVVHSGVVLGADGFGYLYMPSERGGHYRKIPQIGGLVVEDDVEIGANTTIDAGTLAPTRIGCGVKIDNQVHIAHNVEIGKHTAIAGCVGVAGSAKIGAYCAIGGAAMVVGHIDICDHVHIGGGTWCREVLKNRGFIRPLFLSRVV